MSMTNSLMPSLSVIRLSVSSPASLECPHRIYDVDEPFRGPLHWYVLRFGSYCQTTLLILSWRLLVHPHSPMSSIDLLRAS
jgi:hypothetical protein